VGITKKIIQLDGVRKTQVLSKQLSLMWPSACFFSFLRVLIWSHRTPSYFLFKLPIEIISDCEIWWIVDWC
jgi:hypothetical protein